MGQVKDANVEAVRSLIAAGKVDIRTPRADSVIHEGTLYRSALVAQRFAAQTAGDDSTANLFTTLLREVDEQAPDAEFFGHYYASGDTPDVREVGDGDQKDKVLPSARHCRVLTGEDEAKVLQRAGVQSNENTIVQVVSTEDRDRYNTKFKTRGGNLTFFQANPVVLWCHYSGMPPIGKCLKISAKKEDGIGFLEAITEFDDGDLFSLNILRLYKKNYLNQSSIGAIPRAWTDEVVDQIDDDGPASMYSLWGEIRIRTYTSWDLLEYSACPIGANASTKVTERALVTRMLQRAVQSGDLESDDIVIRRLAEDYGFDTRLVLPASRPETGESRIISEMQRQTGLLERALNTITGGAMSQGNEGGASEQRNAGEEKKPLTAEEQRQLDDLLERAGAAHSKKTKEEIGAAVKDVRSGLKLINAGAKRLSGLVGEKADAADEEGDAKDESRTIEELFTELNRRFDGMEQRFEKVERASGVEEEPVSTKTYEAGDGKIVEVRTMRDGTERVVIRDADHSSSAESQDAENAGGSDNGENRSAEPLNLDEMSDEEVMTRFSRQR